MVDRNGDSKRAKYPQKETLGKENGMKRRTCGPHFGANVKIVQPHNGFNMF